MLSLTNYLLRFLRWGRYLALLDAPVPWRTNLDAYFSGFALTTSPGKLAEMLRSVLLRPHGVPAAASMAAFFPERVSNLLSILLLAAVGLWAYASARPVLGLAFAAVIAGLLLVQWTSMIARIDRWAMSKSGK